MKQAPTRVNSELFIPDCCNLGVVFRILIFVNLVVFFSLLARGLSWPLVLQEFAETSILVESICLLSLASLCGLRHLAMRQAVPAWGQRLACGVVPALFCSLLLAYFGQIEWFTFSFPRLQADSAVLLCLVMGGAVQHYFELRMRAFSPALGEAKLQVLQARIRPHFLFNSLNAVLSLIRTEPRRAETALEDLADLFRVLMRDARDMTTVQEEIHLCEQYLAIEKIRLGSRLQVLWRFDQADAADLNAAKMPNLLLQPLLENAVHYGVEPSLAMNTIEIEIRRQLDKILVTIRNPYHGNVQMQKQMQNRSNAPNMPNMPEGNHMALDNIQQRLALLYDIEAQLSYGIREKKPDHNSTLKLTPDAPYNSAQYFEVVLQFPMKK
jgi:two-component system sensor histidine kinase AlgZ